MMYEKGIGFTKDGAKAFAWYRKAAEQGNSPTQSGAKMMLGLMYAQGRVVVQKDKAEALRLFNSVVKERLDGLFSEPDQIHKLKLDFYKQDKTKLAEQYHLGAERGILWDMLYLGDVYTKGFGVEKDEKEAVKWYCKAADQGLAGGQDQLGYMYAEGLGVPKDEDEALKWHIKAAEQDANSTETMIRMIYEYGPF